MLPKSTTIMSMNKKTKSSISTQAKTTLWSLCQQQIPLNVTKILTTNELNKKHNKAEAEIESEAIVDRSAQHDTIASNNKRSNNNNKCIKHKILTITTTTTSAAATEKAIVAQRKHHQHHCKLTALKYNNNSNGCNNSNNINNENNINCSNSYSNYSCKTPTICSKKAISNKRKHQRTSYWSSYPSSPSPSASAPASLSSTCSTSIRFLVSSSSSAHSWIFCLWLCLAISSLAFVHCIPSPSSSIQQPQKRGGGNSDISKDQCNKTVDIFEDVSSPEVTNQNVGRPLTCWYRFRTLKGAPRDFVLRLRFKKFKIGTLINATHCEGGYLQIVDGNAKTDVSNRREPGMFCGEAEQPQTFISETSYVKVMFHTEKFTDQTYFTFDSRAEQQTEVYLRYGQHPELYPNRRGEVVQGSYCEREYRDCRLQTCYVQSPAYPGLYPRALNCRYKLHTRQPYIKLYLQNEQFAVDGQRCENVMTCPIRPIGSGN